MIITARLAEYNETIGRFFALAQPTDSPARRRLLQATSASWLWTSLFCLALFYPLLYLTPAVCSLLLYAMLFQALLFARHFFTQRFFTQTNTKERFQ